MRNIIHIIFGVLLLGIYSCNIPRSVINLIKDTPSQYRGLNVTDTASVGSISVKEFFAHQFVQQLLDSAIQKNLDLQIAIKNIEAANLLLTRAKMGSLPQLSLQVAASSSRPSDNSLNGISASQFLNTTHIEDYNANLALSWEADIWGKISKQKEAAFATYLQTTEVKKAVQTRVVAMVANSFYQLLLLDAQLDIANRNLKLTDSTLKMVTQQFEAGQVTSLAVAQTKAQWLSANQLIPQITQAIQIQENALSELTGRFPNAIERKTTLAQLEVPTQLAAGLPSVMLAMRPDVKSVELGLRAANAKVGVANAAIYPSLIISASGGVNSFKASNWFNVPASLFGVVGAGIVQPIFNRKELKTQFELAKVEREKLVLQFRQSVIKAVVEVANEQTKLENLKAEFSIAQTRVQTLKQAVKNADLLFKSGMASYLEVISAQSNLLQGELNLASLKTAQLSASVELYRALGGGWQ
ncbi:efflux transporter outer membrane subunit [Pedobacter sp.]